MPFRLSCGPDYRRTTIISSSAGEALRLYRALEGEGHECVEIANLHDAKFNLDDLVALARAEERTSLAELTPS